MWPDIQYFVFIIAIIISVVCFGYYACKKKYIFGIFLALLPILFYSFVNFIAESLLYTKIIANRMTASAADELIALMNINVSIMDIKIMLTVLAIIMWFWVWFRVRST